MKIAIVMPIYYRADKKSFEYLNRALKYITAQTHKEYAVYLMGDDYKHPEEIHSILYKFPFVKFINLEQSAERERYKDEPNKYVLWCSGGVTAYNEGIKAALADGFEYICHHDYDDYWEPEHLSFINSAIPFNPLFICTLSTYYGSHLPPLEINHKLYNYAPRKGACITSATCVKYSELLLRFRDVNHETGVVFPSDADFWERVNQFMIENNRIGIIITSVTCHHDEEGSLFK